MWMAMKLWISDVVELIPKKKKAKNKYVHKSVFLICFKYLFSVRFTHFFLNHKLSDRYEIFSDDVFSNDSIFRFCNFWLALAIHFSFILSGSLNYAYSSRYQNEPQTLTIINLENALMYWLNNL